MKKNLSKDKRKELQRKANPLKPIIIIGQKGLTDAVITEIDLALNIHELIKVRIRGVDKNSCAEQCSKIEQQLNADVVHQIGFITVFYRPTPSWLRYKMKKLSPGDRPTLWKNLKIYILEIIIAAIVIYFFYWLTIFYIENS